MQLFLLKLLRLARENREKRQRPRGVSCAALGIGHLSLTKRIQKAQKG